MNISDYSALLSKPTREKTFQEKINKINMYSTKLRLIDVKKNIQEFYSIFFSTFCLAIFTA